METGRRLGLTLCVCVHVRMRVGTPPAFVVVVIRPSSGAVVAPLACRSSDDHAPEVSQTRTIFGPSHIHVGQGHRCFHPDERMPGTSRNWMYPKERRTEMKLMSFPSAFPPGPPGV